MQDRCTWPCGTEQTAEASRTQEEAAGVWRQGALEIEGEKTQERKPQREKMSKSLSDSGMGWYHSKAQG